MNKSLGKQSIVFEEAPHILSGASIAGKKEGEGPLGLLFDQVVEDPMFGCETWEEAESKFQTTAAKEAIRKAGLKEENIKYIFAGDLLGQLIATSFGLVSLNIPLFGMYGACSTMGEALSLASVMVSSGGAKNVIALTSSHFASAEKQFRFPLDYGNQRNFSATWTVTGSGAVVLSDKGGFARVTGITTGKIIDYGVKDNANMGAAMAPAAAEVIDAHFKDFNVKPEEYDKIITGDLGYVGQTILLDLLEQKGYRIGDRHMDCGIEIFDKDTQDTHAGGSGCGCSAITLTSFVFDKLKSGDYKKVLFIPTGALMSPTSYNEGKTIPSIAHCVVIESERGRK